MPAEAAVTAWVEVVCSVVCWVVYWPAERWVVCLAEKTAAVCWAAYLEEEKVLAEQGICWDEFLEESSRGRRMKWLKGLKDEGVEGRR